MNSVEHTAIRYGEQSSIFPRIPTPITRRPPPPPPHCIHLANAHQNPPSPRRRRCQRAPSHPCLKLLPPCHPSLPNRDQAEILELKKCSVDFDLPLTRRFLDEICCFRYSQHFMTHKLYTCQKHIHPRTARCRRRTLEVRGGVEPGRIRLSDGMTSTKFTCSVLLSTGSDHGRIHRLFHLSAPTLAYGSRQKYLRGAYMPPKICSIRASEGSAVMATRDAGLKYGKLNTKTN